MSFIKFCTLALIATSSLTACSSHNQANSNDKTSTSQIEDRNSFINTLKPSSAEAIIGQVTGITSQDRNQQKVTIVAQDGKSYTASISKANFGQQNAYQMQKLAMGDYIEVKGDIEMTGDQSNPDGVRQLTVRAMPYILRKIVVADYKVDCVGVAPQSCLLTKPADQVGSQADWQYRYSGIEGFDYEPNYEYTLLIKNTAVARPPADASSVQSKLIQVIEKKRTQP